MKHILRRNIIIYLPYSVNSINHYTSSMIRLLKKKYEVIGDIYGPFSMLKTKAVFLNWVEDTLDDRLKRKLVLCRLFGVRIIWVMHNKSPHNDNDGKVSDNMKWLMNIASFIIMHSKKSVYVLPEYARKKSLFIPHIKYDTWFNPMIEDYIREFYGIAKEAFLFTYFGNIRPYKNLEGLIKAFSEGNYDNAKLLIVGRTEPDCQKYKLEINQRIAELNNIIFDPREIPEEILNGIIDISDTIILPYHPDSYLNSGVMIHAFSIGKPVISPRFAMAEDYESEGILYIYDTDLNEMMRKAYSNKNENCRKGKVAKDIMDKRNSAELILEELENLLR